LAGIGGVGALGGDDCGGSYAKILSNPAQFLIFRTGQLGDMIAALPAIRAIREQWPKARLTLLCDTHPKSNYVGAADIFRGSGIIDDFEHYEVGSARTTVGRALQRLKLLFRLRRRGFKTLFYLAASIRLPHQVKRDRRFFRVAGIRHFYGMNYFPPVPYRDRSRPLPAAGHEADLLLARLQSDGLKVPAAGQGSLNLELGMAEEGEVAEWLRLQGSDQGKLWIGIGPGSKMPAKRWPLERFESVVSRLIQEFDVWPVVFGGEEDRLIADQLLSTWGRGFNAAGKLSVRAAASALRRCALFLGNDTGTMHLAAAAGTPCVAVFSSRDWPGAWYPYGVERRVFRSTIECEGCYLVECIELGNECLKRISTTEVVDACREVLGRDSRKAEILKTAEALLKS
jgi:heptosyltransferase-3